MWVGQAVVVAAALASHVAPPTGDVPFNGIAEWVLTFNQSEVPALGYRRAAEESNAVEGDQGAGVLQQAVWESVNITLDLTVPSGARPYNATVRGFYYGLGEWHVRAALRAPGVHGYTLTAVRGNTTLHQSTGTVQCSLTAPPQNNSVGAKGFLRPQYTQWPYRTAYEDGTLFSGLGLGDCVNDRLTWATFNETDGGQYTRSFSEYTTDYGEAGFNIFRWSNGNCVWRIEKSFDASVSPWRPVGNVYNETLVLLLDQLYDGFRARGFSMWAVPFAKDSRTPLYPNMGDSNTTWHMAQQQAIGRHLEYVVARWGAQTDVWSLLNEQRATTPWLAWATAYLRQIDPYGHPITSSWNDHLNMTQIELDSVHWYYSDTTTHSVAAARTMIASELANHKPVYFTESGNRAHNWDPDSHTRMRLRSWTSVFSGANLMWWNTANVRNCTPCGGGNMYLGPTERQYNGVLRNFLSKLTDPLVTNVSVAVSNQSGVEALGLETRPDPRGTRLLFAYLHHWANHTSNVTVSVSVPTFDLGGCHGAWVDPIDGTPTDVTVPPSGGSALLTPPFVIDLGLWLECPKSSRTSG